VRGVNKKNKGQHKKDLVQRSLAALGAPWVLIRWIYRPGGQPKSNAYEPTMIQRAGFILAI
jgi:hypothetical protein